MRTALTCILLMSSMIIQVCGQEGEEIVVYADFAQGAAGFVFEDDVFACGSSGNAEGEWDPDGGRHGGALRTAIKQSSEARNEPISGGWVANVPFGKPGLLVIDLAFRVTASGEFSAGQCVDAVATVDDKPLGMNVHGTLLRLEPALMDLHETFDTGWQAVATTIYLSSGSHTLRLGLEAKNGLPLDASVEMKIDAVAMRCAGTVTFTGDGGFAIDSAGGAIQSCSWFSNPGGGWLRLGSGTPSPGEELDWHVEAARQTENRWEGSVATEKFKLQRVIHVTGHRVEVEDTLTNLCNEDLGWMIRHELAVPGTTGGVHLGGDNRAEPSPVYATVIKDGTRKVGIDCWRPANPTVYAPMADLGVGLVIEDDVMRVHGLTYERTDGGGSTVIGVRDEHFALPAGGQYTMRWCAYAIPAPDNDYYDFINHVRADWRANDVRIPGPVVWSSELPAMRQMSDEDLQTRLRKSGAWAVTTSLNGWIASDTPEPGGKFQIGFGPGVLDPYFAGLREAWSQDAERIHRIAPNIKVLHYFHMFLNDPERNPSEFEDSAISRPDGTRMISTWGDMPLTPSSGIFPKPDNTAGRRLLDVLDTMTGPMNGNGIYLDEVNYPTGIGWMGFPPCTYNMWDGHSAELDPATFAVVRKTGYLQLLSKDFKQMLFERLASRGLAILGNGEPDLLWENAATFPRHTECRRDPYPRAYESHLYAPMGLDDDDSFKHQRAMLELGTIPFLVRLDDQSLAREEVIRRSFPITVQEIHAGWIKGRERIITMVSGRYLWHESTRATIYEFDADGLLSSAREAASLTGAFDIHVPENGMVILERTTESQR